MFAGSKLAVFFSRAISATENKPWYVYETKGSHCQLKHSEMSGKITILMHSGDLKPGTLNSILKQAGLK